MKKLFGEYLIEKSIATESQVLEALMEQIRSLPSLCEIIYDNSLLEKGQIIKILAYQMKKGTDFRRACVENGIWDEKLSMAVDRISRAKRKPLGEILIRNGILTQETLTKSLDAFLTENVKGRIDIHNDFAPIQKDLIVIKNASTGSLELKESLTRTFHLIHKFRGMSRMSENSTLESILLDFETHFENAINDTNLDIAGFIKKAETLLKACSFERNKK